MATESQALLLPLDFYRTPHTGAELRAFSFDLPVPAFQEFSAETWVSGAFAILLSRYNGQTQIPLTVVRGRPAQILNLDTDPTLPGRAVLEQTRRYLEGDAEAGGTHSAAAISWLSPGAPPPTEALGVYLHLVVVLSESGQLQAEFIYNPDLFKEASIRRFSRHLEILLSHLAQSPEVALSQLRLLAHEERQWIERQCDGAVVTPSTTPLHEQIQNQASRRPDAIALRYRETRLSYRELNARANQLAHELIRRNTPSGGRVIVCVQPSLDIAVALLAILKAGAVYVPVDPGYPPARIRAILEDTQPTAILSESDLMARLDFTASRGSQAVAKIALDAIDWSQAVDRFSESNPNTSIQLSQIASIYYTSGTTGLPKGVMATHSNLVSYLGVARERYQIDHDEVMPAIARFSFSISMFELMSPLTAGGTLLILDREHIMDPARMGETLSQVSFFHAGPSLLKSLIAHIRRNYPTFDAFSKVRHASSGGDLVAPEVLESLKEIFSSAEVFVIYGCSEISCMGCTYPSLRDLPAYKTFVGRPFTNMSVRILDSSLGLVPVGVIGEIYFSGEGVVQGYLNRPELTAQKFIVIEGRRYYGTGDLGRLSADGWVEILGRSDFQVKLRGMRIELGEVDHHLRRAPFVRDGVAMAKDGPGGEKILVAYFVPDEMMADQPERSDRMSRIRAIRTHLSEHLPDYMQPSRFVELERLPLNHNLKVDRYALPDPKETDFAAGQRKLATPTEIRLAQLWQKRLGISDIDRIGREDHFFDLGGYSLLAVEVIADIERELGVKISGMEILRESLAVLSALCDQRRGKTTIAHLVPSVEVPPVDSIKNQAFYFGKKNGLYGTLATPLDGARASHAVLICAPVGQEQVQSHFILQRLAQSLARQGIPVMRFDYTGCGDSLGENPDFSVERWKEDIAQAYAELKHRTQASSLSGIGVRLGATLLGQTASLGWRQWIFWDAVENGDEYLALRETTHARYLKHVQNLKLGRRPRSIAGAREWLGMVYPDRLQHELRRLKLTSSVGVPSRSIQSSQLGLSREWLDLSRMEQVFPDVGISQKLIEFVL